MAAIKEGDVVYLKSNEGVQMTVGQISPDEPASAVVNWLNKNNKLEVGEFPVVALSNEPIRRT